MFSVEWVYEELLKGGDQLSEWANANFRRSVANAFMKKAEYGLVAHAHASGCTVVTCEVSAPASNKSINIPDVCKAMGVAWTSPHKMLRREGVRFVLST